MRRGWGPRSDLWQLLAVLTAGLTLTVAMAWVTNRALGEARRSRFQARADHLAGELQRLASGHTGILYGLRSLSAATPLTRERFHDYVIGGQLRAQYPGAQAFGFVRRVAADDISAFEAAVQSDTSLRAGGYPGFRARPPAEWAERWVIDFVEPMQGNEAAFGLDVATDDARREALQRARDSGQPTASAPVRLVQETGRQLGVIVFLPIYDGGRPPATVGQRRRHCRGFVAVAYRVGDMLAAVRQSNSDVDFALLDLGVATTPGAPRPTADGHVLYATPAARRQPLTGQKIDLTVAGRRWRLVARPAEGPGPGVGATTAGVAAMGLLFSAVSAHLVFRLSASRRRALARARLLEAGDAQRRVLERNLHDGAQQRLLFASLALTQVDVGDEPEVAAALAAVAEAITESLAELRELAHGLHPAVLSDHGLTVALEAVAARAPLPVDLRLGGVAALPPAVEAAAYYLVSEAMANVAKHARASVAIVTVERGGGQVLVEVSDDGVGGADPASGSGLRGLQDRLLALDGHLSVLSPPGGGTTLRAEIPCA